MPGFTVTDPGYGRHPKRLPSVFWWRTGLDDLIKKGLLSQTGAMERIFLHWRASGVAVPRRRPPGTTRPGGCPTGFTGCNCCAPDISAQQYKAIGFPSTAGHTLQISVAEPVSGRLLVGLLLCWCLAFLCHRCTIDPNRYYRFSLTAHDENNTFMACSPGTGFGPGYRTMPDG